MRPSVISLPHPVHFVMGFGAGAWGSGAAVTGAGAGTGVDDGCGAGAACGGALPGVGLPQNGQKFSPSGTSLPHPVHCLVFWTGAGGGTGAAWTTGLPQNLQNLSVDCIVLPQPGQTKS